MSKIIAFCNQKGGVGKTTTCSSLGTGLARQEKKVLLVDCDPQGSLTISLGYRQPDMLPITLSMVLDKVLNDKPLAFQEGIIHHAEGIDIMPANFDLSQIELSLVNVMSREKVLSQYLDGVKSEYDFVLVDCMPSLGMLTINALAAADSVLIPVQAQYLAAKGLEQILQSVIQVRRRINPNLAIEGILLTMVDNRTTCAREISALIREVYGSNLRIFETVIPHSVRAAETSAEGTSIYIYDPKGKVAVAYRDLTEEVLKNER